MLTLKKAFIGHKPERRLAAALMAALLILTTALPTPAWQDLQAMKATRASS